jgi:hypothetical protein
LRSACVLACALLWSGAYGVTVWTSRGNGSVPVRLMGAGGQKGGIDFQISPKRERKFSVVSVWVLVACCAIGCGGPISSTGVLCVRERSQGQRRGRARFGEERDDDMRERWRLPVAASSLVLSQSRISKPHAAAAPPRPQSIAHRSVDTADTSF